MFRLLNWMWQRIRGSYPVNNSSAPNPSAAMHFPADFALPVHQAIATHVIPYLKKQSAEAEDNFNGGWMGVAHRFRVCADADDAFSASIKVYPSVAGEERFRQEQSLFVFIMAGYSAVECFCYALYWMGANRRPPDFPVQPKDLKGVFPKSVATRFQSVYPGHALASALDDLVNHVEFDKWMLARNLLAHRAQPPRIHAMISMSQVTTELKLVGLEINDQTTAAKRLWLSQQLDKCFNAAQQFVIAEFI